MNMKRICCIISLFVLCLTFNQAHAQRCLPGMKGLQVTGGMADGVHWNSKSDFAYYFGVALSTYTKTGTGGLLAGNTSKSITPTRICKYQSASLQARAVTI